MNNLARYNPIIMACWALPILMLLVGIFPMPDTYYLLLKIVIFGTSVTTAALERSRKRWIFLSMVPALLYNPFTNINLDKSVWDVMHMLTLILYAYHCKRYYSMYRSQTMQFFGDEEGERRLKVAGVESNYLSFKRNYNDLTIAQAKEMEREKIKFFQKNWKFSDEEASLALYIFSNFSIDMKFCTPRFNLPDDDSNKSNIREYIGGWKVFSEFEHEKLKHKSMETGQFYQMVP